MKYWCLHNTYNGSGGQDLTWKPAVQMAKHLVGAEAGGLDQGLRR
jgi:hypothetical protein